MPSHEDLVPSWGDYVSTVLGDMSNVEACDRMPSINSPNTIANWRRGTVPSLKLLVEFSRTFYRPLEEVLAAAGAPLNTPAQGINVRQMPIKDLLEIVYDRVVEDEARHPRLGTRGRRKSRRRFAYNPDTPPV